MWEGLSRIQHLPHSDLRLILKVMFLCQNVVVNCCFKSLFMCRDSEYVCLCQTYCRLLFCVIVVGHFH